MPVLVMVVDEIEEPLDRHVLANVLAHDRLGRGRPLVGYVTRSGKSRPRASRPPWRITASRRAPPQPSLEIAIPMEEGVSCQESEHSNPIETTLLHRTTGSLAGVMVGPACCCSWPERAVSVTRIWPTLFRRQIVRPQVMRRPRPLAWSGCPSAPGRAIAGSGARGARREPTDYWRVRKLTQGMMAERADEGLMLVVDGEEFGF